MSAEDALRTLLERLGVEPDDLRRQQIAKAVDELKKSIQERWRADLDRELAECTEMIAAMASFDFSRKAKVGDGTSLVDVMGTGLNMLSEEMAVRIDEERKLRARLLHSDRLVAVGQLAAGVAHEVNNPAAFIIANLETLKEHHALWSSRLVQSRLAAERGDLEAIKGLLDDQQLDDTFHEAADMLQDNLSGMKRIVSIVRDLRTFSRTERDHIESVDLSEVIRIAANMTSKDIRYRAKLVTQIEDVPPVMGDRGKLTQVVTNLLVNAGQAIAEGNPEGNQVSVTCKQVGPEIHITVEDTGCGMSEETKRRAFEPFYTTKPRETGTGLGLSLCGDIVRQHRGSLLFDSELGRGTKFLLSLPLEQPKAAEVVVPAAKPSQPNAAHLPKLLVVDDELALLGAYRRNLSKKFQVTLAASGTEGLAKLKQDDFDVVLCDVMMTDMDGPSLYEAITKEKPEAADRFIFCSGGAFTPRTKDFIATVKCKVLAKPLDVSELTAAVRELAGTRVAAPRAT